MGALLLLGLVALVADSSSTNRTSRQRGRSSSSTGRGPYGRKYKTTSEWYETGGTSWRW